MYTDDDHVIEHLLGEDSTLRGKAMQWLYLEALPSLQKLVGRYRQENDKAVDLASEGLIKLIENLNEGKFRGEASLKTYFLSICFGSLMNQIRKGNKHVDIDNHGDIHPAFQIETRSRLDDAALLQLCLEKLPDFCASVFSLRYWGEGGFPLKDEQIAERVGLGSAQAVATKFNRKNCWKLIRDCYFGRS